MALNIKSFYPVIQVLASKPRYRVLAIQNTQDQANILDPKKETPKQTKKKIAKAKKKLNII